MAKNKPTNPDEPTLDLEFTVTEEVQETGPVTVLGMTFANDDERRAYFRAQLREKLPELRKIEGFPIGSDDDIVNLSDPPYYTACPNPWLNAFIDQWEEEKKQLEADGFRQPNFEVAEPYAADVSEGKANPIYMAHAYHTKVPHPAIMRYIMHYTQPGDIVFDGFAGTGMTGVAAGKCSEKNDIITKSTTSYGLRHCICNDLSPIASFICYNFNHPSNGKVLFSDARRRIERVKKEYGQLYDVQASESAKTPMSYVLWSEVMTCPSCGHNILYFNDAFDPEGERNDFCCPSCGNAISKKNLERFFETVVSNNGEIVNRVKLAPAAVRYKHNKQWHQRPLSEAEIQELNKLESVPVNQYMPNSEIPEGFNTNQILRTGRHNVCDLYTKRNLIIFSELWKESQNNPILRFGLTAILVKTGSLLHNVGFKKGKINLAGALPNVLYIPSILAERNIFDLLEGKLKDLEKIEPDSLHSVINEVQSATDLSNMATDSVDYIFTDPPFGSNIMYSDLNFIHESWLHVLTNAQEEAIENPNQNNNSSLKF